MKKQKTSEKDKRERTTAEKDRTREKAREPTDHRSWRTRLSGREDENPPPVDVDLDVLKKGRKAVNRISRIASESESDNNVTIVKGAGKESQLIILDKV